jgi:outer membrane protein OmpA-like peptidoglycan-associated protein
MARKFLAVAAILLMAGVCRAGWLEDAIKRTGESLGNRAVDEAGDTAYEGAKKGARGAVKKGSDRDAGESDESRPETGSTEADDDGVKTKRTGGKRSSSDAPASGSGGSPSGDATIEQAEAIQSKYDFIPGDRTIFFDDFSDTDVGEFPRKWTLSGPKEVGNNSVEVVGFQGKRYLRSQPGRKGGMQEESTQYIRLSGKGDLPEKFTIEFDAVFAGIHGETRYHTHYRLLLLDDDTRFPGDREPGVLFISGKESHSANTGSELDLVDGRPHRVQVSVNGTFVKAYVDRRRVINDPDGVKRPIRLVGINMGTPGREDSDKVMFTNFRLAQGGKDIRAALDTDGKIVTHGILFDSGRDVLKAESLPTLKMILGLLRDDPGLRFSIEGHTDNQGGKDVNRPLSERRAAAVKAWLAGKGIDGSRMKTKGFGDSKPIDSNGTPEGRANNRRVEFVKF